MSARRERQALDALLRQDLASFTLKAFNVVNPGDEFLQNWHIHAICWHLQKCYRGEIKRLIITVPPRHLKSVCASVAFPAWVLGQDPTRKLICVSYAQDLARKHALDTRTVMEAAWYRRVFPRTRFNPRRNPENELTTTEMGVRYATSIGGTLTGLGGNFLIIDDPIKAHDVTSEAERARVNNFYSTSLYSRLNNKNEDVIILIMQRLHDDDLVAHVLQQDDWTVLSLPAIADQDQTYEIGKNSLYHRAAGEVLHEAREDAQTLENIKRQLGSLTFEAQYQQRPVPSGGNLIRREWLKTYPEKLPRKDYDLVVQSWDTASSVSERSDYSVGITFGIIRGTAHILDVIRVRADYPTLRRRVQEAARKSGADVIVIEDANSGTPLGQDLRREGKMNVINLRPRGDKLGRLEVHTAKLEAGHVLLPESAPWRDDLIAELLAFPRGRHDDQVDALTQFMEWFSRHRRNELEAIEREEDYARRCAGLGRTTWYQRNRGLLTSNQGMLERFHGGGRW